RSRIQRKVGGGGGKGVRKKLQNPPPTPPHGNRGTDTLDTLLLFGYRTTPSTQVHTRTPTHTHLTRQSIGWGRETLSVFPLAGSLRQGQTNEPRTCGSEIGPCVNLMKQDTSIQ